MDKRAILRTKGPILQMKRLFTTSYSVLTRTKGSIDKDKNVPHTDKKAISTDKMAI